MINTQNWHPGSLVSFPPSLWGQCKVQQKEKKRSWPLSSPMTALHSDGQRFLINLGFSHLLPKKMNSGQKKFLLPKINVMQSHRKGLKPKGRRRKVTHDPPASVTQLAPRLLHLGRTLPPPWQPLPPLRWSPVNFFCCKSRNSINPRCVWCCAWCF